LNESNKSSPPKGDFIDLERNQYKKRNKIKKYIIIILSIFISTILIFFYINNLNVKDSSSKLIKILLMTPNLGKGFNNLKELKPNEYAWMIESNNLTNKNQNYQIIASDKNLNPWKLIKKKI